MDIIMDVSIESSIGSWCRSVDHTPEVSLKSRKQLSSMEDSGYSSCSHDSETRYRHVRKHKDILTSPDNLSWCTIFPEKLKPTSDTLLEQKDADLLVRLCNYPHILKKVFSHLRPDDLVRCCLVSKAWKEICGLDNDSRLRRQMYLSFRGLKNKENLGVPEELTMGPNVIRKPVTSTPLAPIPMSRQLNFCQPANLPESPIVAATPETRDRFTVFFLEGLKLSPGKSQRPCPICSMPARVDQSIMVGQCSQAQCRFQFCLICRSKQHIEDRCPASQLNYVQCKWPRSLNSKACRRNLRRL